MTDGTISLTTEGGQTFSQHYYSYMDTGRSNLAVRTGIEPVLSCSRCCGCCRRSIETRDSQRPDPVAFASTTSRGKRSPCRTPPRTPWWPRVSDAARESARDRFAACPC